MDIRIGLILKLLWNKGIAIMLFKSLRLINCTLHALTPRCELYLCAKRCDYFSSLNAHGIRHYKYQVKPL